MKPGIGQILSHLDNATGESEQATWQRIISTCSCSEELVTCLVASLWMTEKGPLRYNYKKKKKKGLNCDLVFVRHVKQIRHLKFRVHFRINEGIRYFCLLPSSWPYWKSNIFFSWHTWKFYNLVGKSVNKLKLALVASTSLVNYWEIKTKYKIKKGKTLAQMLHRTLRVKKLGWCSKFRRKYVRGPNGCSHGRCEQLWSRRV